jgi:hypothetical protein
LTFENEYIFSIIGVMFIQYSVYSHSLTEVNVALLVVGGSFLFGTGLLSKVVDMKFQIGIGSVCINLTLFCYFN